VLGFIRGRNIFDRHVFQPAQVLWMLKDRAFFGELVAILKRKKYYDGHIWNFAFYHNDMQLIREIIQQRASRAAPLPVFEYYPYYSSRAHLFAHDARSTIRNVEFKETYAGFLLQSVIRPPPAHEFLLVFAYYLILQDRVSEAQALLQGVSEEDYRQHEIQYDYVRCFLDMSLNCPNFTDSRALVKKYEHYPVASWKRLFDEVRSTLEAGEDDVEEEV
jgi:hypothetical protein